MFVQIQIRRNFPLAHKMAIILRIMPTEERKRALAEFTVDILRIVRAFHLPQNRDRTPNSIHVKRCRLPKITGDNTHMVLRQHRRNRIVLSSEFKQDEILNTTLGIHVRTRVVYIRKFITERIGIKREILKRERPLKI